MGCAAYAGNLDKKGFAEGVVKRIESFRQKVSSDDSVSVVEVGQVVVKTQLDCYVESALRDKDCGDIILKRMQARDEVVEGGHRDGDSLKAGLGVADKEIDEKDESESKKIRFEVHPHNFDFSFLEERVATEHEEITDLVMKEILNL